jgi:hypothetical protein
VLQQEEREREGGERDHDPEPLAEGVGRVQAVDLGQADAGQQAGHRQQVRVRVGDGQARDEVRGQVEREEEPRVRQRSRRDDVLTRDVDAGEAERGEDADDDEVGELAVPVGHFAPICSS